MSAGGPLDIPDPFLVEVHGPSLPEHFYYHIPFCRSKCSYCDFYSIADASAETTYALFAGLEAETRRWALSALPGVVETIYVGGGTPSLHPAPVARLLEHARTELPCRPDAEITVEGNPDSLGHSAVGPLAEAGATRISVGVQAFDDKVLRTLRRAHDAATARASCVAVREYGVDLAVDLMCGVPGQTRASWIESLEEAIDAGASHVSIYPLTVEEHTPIAEEIAAGVLAEPDPDVAAEMMLDAADKLERAGMRRYEVANYARPGHESRHNSAYWTGGRYVGIGPGAHGMLDAQTARSVGLLLSGRDAAPERTVRVRYSSARDIDSWLLGGRGEIETLTGSEAAREDVMLGLRLVRGVSAVAVEAAALTPVLEGLRSDGLVEYVAGQWRTTTQGWLLGNEVFRRIWTGG